MDLIKKELAIIKKGILADAPLVADFFDTATTIQEFSENIHKYTAQTIQKERQKTFKKVVRKKLLETFSEKKINNSNINWEEDWKINIVEHHAILNHPILLGTHLISQIYQLPSKNPQGIIVLSDSGVPFNNFFHKRGLKFKGNQHNIFPDRIKHVVSYASPIINNFPLQKSGEKYNYSNNEKGFLKKIEFIMSESNQQPGVKNYKDQVKIINHKLWPLLFDKKIRTNIPDLFLVSNEEIAIDMLKEYFKKDSNIFWQLLFDKKIRELTINTFNDITGCWSTNNNKGTFFFWGINKNNETVNLTIQNNKLVNEKASISVTLSPESIIKACEEEKIYPGMFLVYGISIFYCGIKPLVGYGSMNYQTKMKEAWIKLMNIIDMDEAKMINRIPTNAFIGGPKVTFTRKNNKFVDLFALDCIYKGGLDREYLDNLRKMPFKDLLLPALIDIYNSYVDSKRKQKISITSDDLMGNSFSWLK